MNNEATFKKGIKIEDGIINQDKWNKAKLKVLIVLKECYGGLNIADEDEEPKYSYSICKYINKWGATGHTYMPIGRWLKALGNCDGDIDDCIKAAAIIEIINISGENRTTSTERLREFFDEKRQKEVEKQVRKINPDVIIFGNTYWLFEEAYQTGHYGKDKEYVGKVEKESSPLNGKIIYNGYHPSCRYFRKEGEYNNPNKIAELIKKYL